MSGKKLKKAREERKWPVPLGDRKDGMVPPLSNVAEWSSNPDAHPLTEILELVGNFAYRDTRFVFRICRLFKSLGNVRIMRNLFFRLLSRFLSFGGYY